MDGVCQTVMEIIPPNYWRRTPCIAILIGSGMVRVQEAELPDVVIYTKSWCGHCMTVKALLRRRGVASWNEFNIEVLPEKKREMIQRTGGRTSVPQVFIDGEYVGGSTELHDLDQAGRLAPLLNGMNPILRYAS